MSLDLSANAVVAGGPDAVPDIRTFAHVAVDVQDEYCNPKRLFRLRESVLFLERGNPETWRAAEKIIRIAPEFNRLGLPNYWVYTNPLKGSPSENGIYRIGFGYIYAVSPLYKQNPPDDKNNILVEKNATSAFQGSDIQALLEKRGIQNLLVSGFNFNACVFRTALDARKKGFNVWLMMDVTANDRENKTDNDEAWINQKKESLIRAGVVLTDSTTVLRQLEALAPVHS